MDIQKLNKIVKENVLVGFGRKNVEKNSLKLS